MATKTQHPKYKSNVPVAPIPQYSEAMQRALSRMYAEMKLEQK